jgi:hypothetical protein
LRVAGTRESCVAPPRRTGRLTAALATRATHTMRTRRVTLAALASAAVCAVSASSAVSASAATTATTATTGTTGTATGTGTDTGNPKFSTPDQWVLGAIAAQEKLGSVRVDGKVTEGRSQILLDLLVNGDGEGGGVFIEDGNAIKIERVGTLLYLDAPKKFWAAHATAAQTKTYGGKWLALDATDTRFASFDQFLDPTALVAAAFRGHTTPLTMGKPTTFAGHKVVAVRDSSEANGKTTTETMYIGSASPHDVYKIVDDTPSEAGTIVFSHYGKAVPLTVPPEPLDLTNSS